MKHHTLLLAVVSLFLPGAGLLYGVYQYYYTDLLTSVNLTNWSQNGSVTATSGGLTAPSTNGGSLISRVAVPDGSNEYEVKTTLNLTANGGTYVTYLRASTDALSGPAPTGTYYAVELQNPTFNAEGACTATLMGYKRRGIRGSRAVSRCYSQL